MPELEGTAEMPLANFVNTVDSLSGFTAEYEVCRMDVSIYPGIASDKTRLIVCASSEYLG